MNVGNHTQIDKHFLKKFNVLPITLVTFLKRGYETLLENLRELFKNSFVYAY